MLPEIRNEGRGDLLALDRLTLPESLPDDPVGDNRQPLATEFADERVVTAAVKWKLVPTVSASLIRSFLRPRRVEPWPKTSRPR